MRVPDRRRAAERDKKMLGFVLDEARPVFRIPRDKAHHLQVALRWMASYPVVDTSLLHSVVGVWIWAALLNRPLLAALSYVFGFLEAFPRARVAWWPSARREVVLMARLVPAMTAYLDRRPFPWVFATDAEGDNRHDRGGYGLMAAFAGNSLAEELAQGAPRPGRTVANLNGSFTSMHKHVRELDARVSASRVPPAIFDLSWMPVLGRRFHRREHITMLEARASLVLLELLASMGCCRGRTVLSLEDNEAWSAAVAKGRSPRFIINMLLKRRTALCLTAEIDFELPWTDTIRQPADWLSRLR